jgi:hypothetical protein
VLDYLGYRAAAPCDYRCSGCQRLDHDEPEGLGPIDRKQQGARLSEELSLSPVVDLADKLDQRVVQQRFNLPLKILLIHGINFRCNLQWQAAAFGDFDCPVRALFRCNAA